MGEVVQSEHLHSPPPLPKPKHTSGTKHTDRNIPVAVVDTTTEYLKLCTTSERSSQRYGPVASRGGPLVRTLHTKVYHVPHHAVGAGHLATLGIILGRD